MVKSGSSASDSDSGTTVLVNGLLIDGTGTGPVENATVVIHGDRIQSVGCVGECDIPQSAKILDLHGAAILPGFINAHVHGSQDEDVLRKWAINGVTTVREMSGNADELLSRWELQEDRKVARLIMVGGSISRKGGYTGVNNEVDSPQSARKKVLELADAGADLIKIGIEDTLQGRKWEMLSQEEMNAIVETAHERGLRVTTHVTRARHVRMAIEAGVDDLGHMAVDEIPEGLISEIIEAGVYWVPTLELWEGVSRAHGLDWYVCAADNLRRFVGLGGKVALGTDYDGYVCEFDLGMPITEILLMEKAGMSPMQIIVAATENAAYVCDIDKEVGTLTPGKIADIIVVRGNPLEELEALRDIEMVIHNGVIIQDLR